MFNKPLLSICIPTWNRGYCLAQVIDNIVDQPEFHSGKVELVISDNASTDNTESLVRSYQSKYKNIRYEKNEKNIGAMPNISKVLTMGNGEYIRGLGSDDLILNGGLYSTLTIIKKYHPDIIIHSASINADCDFLIRPEQEEFFYENNALLFDSQKNYLNYLGDRYLSDKSGFINKSGLNLSYLSILCMKKSIYEKSKKSIIKDKGQGFFNHFSFLHTLSAHYEEIDKGIIFLLKPFIQGAIMTDHRLAKNAGWNPRFDIANNICYLNNHLVRKYELNKNFRKFRNKSNFYWLLGAIANWGFFAFPYRFLKKLGILHKIQKFISKM